MDAEQDKMLKTAHNKIFIAPPMDIELEKSLHPAAGAESFGPPQR